MSNRKSGHKTHTETPSQPITDAELRSDFIKQYQYGFECGRNWAKTASSEAFREALHRKTVKEQMSKYFDLLAEYTEWTREHTEFICGEWETEYSVTPPHEDYDCHEEISEFFFLMVHEHPCFQGLANHNTDPEICCKNLYLRNIPTLAFRRMEEGWSDGVKS